MILLSYAEGIDQGRTYPFGDGRDVARQVRGLAMAARWHGDREAWGFYLGLARGLRDER